MPMSSVNFMFRLCQAFGINERAAQGGPSADHEDESQNRSGDGGAIID